MWKRAYWNVCKFIEFGAGSEIIFKRIFLVYILRSADAVSANYAILS